MSLTVMYNISREMSLRIDTCMLSHGYERTIFQCHVTSDASNAMRERMSQVPHVSTELYNEGYAFKVYLDEKSLQDIAAAETMVHFVAVIQQFWSGKDVAITFMQACAGAKSRAYQKSINNRDS
jgi:hypothetical protein